MRWDEVGQGMGTGLGDGIRAAKEKEEKKMKWNGLKKKTKESPSFPPSLSPSLF